MCHINCKYNCKFFININSFNTGGGKKKPVRRYYHAHVLREETKVQRGEMTGSK